MTSRTEDRLLKTLTLKRTNDTGITLKSSNTNIHEYILPSSVGTDGQVLKIESIDSNKATLTWSAGGGFSGGNASTITLANETSDSDCFVIFSNDATGNKALKTNNDTNNAIKFNSTNGTLTASTFNGNLTGNATNATNLSNTVPITLGGTGATTASTARTALGVDAAGTDNSTDLMLSSVTDNYLSLDEDNQILSADVVPITLGGTNATTDSAARTALGVDAAGTDNSTNVMLSSVAGNYLTLDEDNQILTAGLVPISLGGTNATSSSTARSALGIDAAGTDNSTNVMLSSVADNYLTLDEDNQILTAGVVPISLGGTGATSASTARTALGVDAAGTDNSTNVMLSSVAGNYLTLDEDNQILTAGIVPISLGGTNATSASAARSNLEIQENVGFVNGDKTKLDSIDLGANVTTSARVSAAGAFMTNNSINTLTGNLVIGENDNDLMVVNSDMITNGYIRSSSRFSPVTNLNPTPLEFTIDSTSKDNIKHLDSDSSGNIDTSVYLNDIRDIDRVLVMGKIHIGFSGPNIFASVLLIKRLYDSSNNILSRPNVYEPILGVTAGTSNTTSITPFYTPFRSIDFLFNNLFGVYEQSEEPYFTANNSNPKGITIVFSSAYIVKRVSLWRSPQDTSSFSQSPEIFKIFGSNTGNSDDWTTLHDNTSSPFTFSDYPNTSGRTNSELVSDFPELAKNFDLDNTTAYTHYKVEVPSVVAPYSLPNFRWGQVEMAFYIERKNTEVGSGTDNQSNTRNAFLDGSNGLTMTRNKNWQVAILRNLGGHFLDTNPTEGVSGVSKISYHYAIIPLNDTPLDESTDSVDGIRIATPVNTGDNNRCSAATILSLVPFSCNL